MVLSFELNNPCISDFLMRKLNANIIDMGNFTTLWPLYGAPATTN